LRGLILICGFLLVRAATLSAQIPVPSLFNRLEWNELRPSSLASDAMLSDGIVGPKIVDDDGKSILMTGNSHVWRWNLVDGAVSRTLLPRDKMGVFSLLTASKTSITGVDEHGAWVFDRKFKSWRRADGVFENSCHPRQVSVIPREDADKIYIISECGIYLFLREPSKLIAAVGDQINVLRNEPAIIAGVSENIALVPEGHELFMIRFDGPRVQKKLVYMAKSRIKGVVSSGGVFIAWTAQALIFLDHSFYRVQVVPVLGRRKIQSFSAQNDQHLVLFSDGAVELMNLSSKTKWAGDGFSAVRVDFVSDGSKAILSLEVGVPRVFSMTNLR
jgi:hypothetical protein